MCRHTQTHVQLILHQDPHIIFWKTPFCAADIQPVPLHGFILSALGTLRVTTRYTSKHWPLPSMPKQSSEFSTWFTVFHWILQSTHAVSSCQSMVAKECSLLCGKAYNYFTLFSFIIAAYLFMLFFSWHPLGCTCPWLPNFDYRGWDFMRKKTLLFFSLIFCYYIEK